MNIEDITFEQSCCGAQAQVVVGDKTYLFTKRSAEPDVVGVEVYSVVTNTLAEPAVKLPSAEFGGYIASLQV